MRYKPLKKDSPIDAEVALIQGCLALDAAGVTAEKLGDVEGLLNVSALWMKFSESIIGLIEEAEKAESRAKEGEMVKSSVSKIETGFQAVRPEVEPITIEEDEDGGIDPEEY